MQGDQIFVELRFAKAWGSQYGVKVPGRVCMEEQVWNQLVGRRGQAHPAGAAAAEAPMLSPPPPVSGGGVLLAQPHTQLLEVVLRQVYVLWTALPTLCPLLSSPSPVCPLPT